MMLFKKETVGISSEKIGLISEKGIGKVRLSNKEKEALLEGGLEEVYSLFDSRKGKIEPLDSAEVNDLVDSFFPEKKSSVKTDSVLILKFREMVVETVESLEGWTVGSPVFAYRSAPDAQGISFHKEIGRLSIHLEVIRRDKRLADLRVFLTDDTGRDKAGFEIDLFKAGACVESLNVKPGIIASLCAVEIGDYELRLADQKGELTTLRIRME